MTLTLYWAWRLVSSPPLSEPSNSTGRVCECLSFECLRAAFVQDSEARYFRVPHFWIGGGQKCGTTTMYAMLGRHPQIVAPQPKEPGYFAWPAAARLASERWYIKKVLRLDEACERGLSNVATFDATAYYLQWGSRVARALKVSAPWARVVLIFREPLARSMSWLQHMALKFPNIPNCLHYRSMDCCVQQAWFLEGVHHLGGSKYYANLQTWLRAGWTHQDMHFVRFEDIVETPSGLARVYRGILAFLGLNLAPCVPKAARQPFKVTCAEATT